MTKNETAKKLAEDANKQRLGNQSETIEILSKMGSEKVEELTERIASLAEAMAKVTDSTKATMTELQATAKKITTEADNAMEKVRWATRKIEDQAERMTLKTWIAMILVACLTSAIAVASYEMWQAHYGPLQADATGWRDFKTTFQSLGEAKQRELRKLLGWDQKR